MLYAMNQKDYKGREIVKTEEGVPLSIAHYIEQQQGVEVYTVTYLDYSESDNVRETTVMHLQGLNSYNSMLQVEVKFYYANENSSYTNIGEAYRKYEYTYPDVPAKYVDTIEFLKKYLKEYMMNQIQIPQ